MLRRKIVSAVLCGALMLSVSGSVWAMPDVYSNSSTIAPRLSHITLARASIVMSTKGVASFDCAVVGHSDVTKTSITATLQQEKNGKWSNVKSWSTTANKVNCSLSQSVEVTKGYNYRVVAKCTAYNGTGSETVNVTSGTAEY